MYGCGMSTDRNLVPGLSVLRQGQCDQTTDGLCGTYQQFQIAASALCMWTFWGLSRGPLLPPHNCGQDRQIVESLANAEHGDHSYMATFLEAWQARFGVIAAVTSDKGSQFTNYLWTSYFQRLGINT
jgi:hypothetical protein